MSAPRSFGDYELLGELGRGGSGAVFRARFRGDGRTVALKLLHAGRNPSPEVVGRFEREVRAGMSLDHPGIAKVIDAGESQGTLFLALELVDGKPLAQLLPALSLDRKVAILEKIARAVHHAHERGYVHRDLKPQNVLVTAALEPVVVDFGLVKVLETSEAITKSGVVLGTYAYLAPEQAVGSADVGPWTDVWALGAILWEMLAGEPPFGRAATLETLRRIAEEPARDPRSVAKDVPEDLAAVALRALRKDARERFDTAAQLALALGSSSTSARLRLATPPSVEGARARGLFRAPVLAAGFVVLLGAGVGIGRALGPRRPPAPPPGDVAALRARAAELVARTPSSANLAAELQDVRAALAPELVASGSLEDRELGLALAGALVLAGGANTADPVLALGAVARLTSRSDARLALASELHERGRLEEAARALEDWTPEGARPADLDRVVALRLACDDPRGATEALERAVALEPSPARRASLVRLLARAGATERADELAGPAEGDRDVASKLARAETLLATKPGAAVALARAAERRAPEKAHELHLEVASFLLRAERTHDARAAFERILREHPDDPVALAGKAEADLLLGDVRAAVEGLRKIGEPLAAATRARARAVRIVSVCAPDELEGLARDALATNPGDASVRLSMLFADPSLEPGPEALGRSFSPGPLSGTSPRPAREDDLAAVARDLGRRPDATHAWAALARVRVAHGDLAGALAASESALALAPRSSEARWTSALVRAARASAQNDRNALRKAVDDARAAQAAFATDPDEPARVHRASLVAARIFERYRRAEDGARAGALLALARGLAPWAAAPRVEDARRRLAAALRAPDAERPRLLAVAQKLVGDAVALGDDSAATNALLARTLLEVDAKANARRALALVEKALATDPNQRAWRFVRAWGRLAVGNAASAESELAATWLPGCGPFEAGVDVEDPMPWLVRAEAALALGRAEEAQAHRARALVQRNARAEAARRAKEARHGDADVRAAKADEALALDPTSWEANFARSDATVSGAAASDPEATWRWFARAVHGSPRSLDGILDTWAAGSMGAEYLVSTATRFEEQGHGSFEAAWTSSTLRCLAHVLVANPRLPDVEHTLGLVEESLALDPSALSAYAGRGYLRALLGQHELALEDEALTESYFGDVSLVRFTRAIAFAARHEPAKVRAELAALVKKGERALVERASRRDLLREAASEALRGSSEPR